MAVTVRLSVCVCVRVRIVGAGSAVGAGKGAAVRSAQALKTVCVVRGPLFLATSFMFYQDRQGCDRYAVLVRVALQLFDRDQTGSDAFVILSLATLMSTW